MDMPKPVRVDWDQLYLEANKYKPQLPGIRTLFEQAWEQLVRGLGIPGWVYAGRELLMTEKEWLECTNPHTLLAYLVQSKQVTIRKLRLLACAMLAHSDQEQILAAGLNYNYGPDGEGIEKSEVIRVVNDWCATQKSYDPDPKTKCELIRDIWANPYQPYPRPCALTSTPGDRPYSLYCTTHRVPTVQLLENPNVGYVSSCCSGSAYYLQFLANTWNNATVRKMLEEMLASNDLSGLPAVADALEDAGWPNDLISQHLRGQQWCEWCSGRGWWTVESDPENHTFHCTFCKGKGAYQLPGVCGRGCWAVNLILGRDQE